ncbi:MAG: Acetate kinase [Syntrophorhabdus sp. PtaU1.Bin153]|nr:MAG: Acetate kinase [Syntrophorhabdus sp. PtaU1.Bin153]
MRVAVINCGSSSIKYEVFNTPDLAMLATGLIEKIGGSESCLRQRKCRADGTFKEQSHTKPLADHYEGFEFMASVNKEDRIVKDDSELVGIGHRVVHGGEVFREPTVIDQEVVAAIRRLIPLAPLHNPSNLLGIEAAMARFPGIPQVAVFDTAFHQTLPPWAFHYAVPSAWYTEYHVRKYGFHGTSHFYVSREAAQHLGKEPESVNLITLHLGNGASVAAVQRGVSVDTSMGLTPLEGLVMGTRSGDIDPALHFYLMRQTGMSADELEKFLNSQSGLKGVCGLNDMREIIDRAEGDARAALALDMFCYRVKKYIGSYIAVLGRVDALVFTGGIGENSATVRSRICSGLERMGIIVDEQRNATCSGNIASIHEESAPVKTLVIRTDEEREIARQTIHAVKKAGL